MVGDLSAGSLKQYEKTWQAMIGRDLLAGRLGKFIFQRLPDRILNRILIKAHDSGVIERLLKDESLTFDWHGRAILKAGGAMLASLF